MIPIHKGKYVCCVRCRDSQRSPSPPCSPWTISFHTAQSSAGDFNCRRIIPHKWQLITLLAQAFSCSYSWFWKARSEGLALQPEPKQTGFRWPWKFRFECSGFPRADLSKWMLKLMHFVVLFCFWFFVWFWGFFPPLINTSLYPLRHLISPSFKGVRSPSYLNIFEYPTRGWGFQGDWVSWCLLYSEIPGPDLSKPSLMRAIVSWHFSCWQGIFQGSVFWINVGKNILWLLL